MALYHITYDRDFAEQMGHDKQKFSFAVLFAVFVLTYFGLFWVSRHAVGNGLWLDAPDITAVQTPVVRHLERPVKVRIVMATREDHRFAKNLEAQMQSLCDNQSMRLTVRRFANLSILKSVDNPTD